MVRACRIPIVAFAAAFLSASVVEAQNIGVTAGLNVATLSGGSTGTEQRSNRLDFMVGGSVIFPMSDMIGIQADLVYSRQGVKIKDTGIEGTFKVNYITLPVLLRFELSDAKEQMRPAFYVGPYVAFKAGCSAEFKAGTVSASGDCESTTVNAPVKSTDFGATVGGELGFGSLGVFARYSMGLTSIDDAKTNKQDVKNRVITIGGRWTVSK